GQAIKSFQILVRETPKATPSVNVLTCGKVALTYTPLKVYTGLSKSWSIRKAGTNEQVWSSLNQTDTAFLQPGTYRVNLSLTTTTPCLTILSDTIIIPEFVKVTLPNDTSFCLGSGTNINSVTTGGNAPYYLNWYQVS